MTDHLPLSDLPTIKSVFRVSQGFWRVSVQVGPNSHNVYCEAENDKDHEREVTEKAWDIVIARLRESVP